MQASEFTVGKDISFRDRLPDTTNVAGQTLLAHELAHTLQRTGQPVRRLRNPLKQSDEATAKDTQARLEAKSVNKANKDVSAKISAGYAGGGAGRQDHKVKRPRRAREGVPVLARPRAAGA